MNKKSIITGIMACCSALAGFAAPNIPLSEYVPGEVIVKFKSGSNVVMRANAKGRFATSGVKSLDATLKNLGVTETNQLMPLTGKTVTSRKLKAINGREFSDVELSTLYLLKFDASDVAKTYELISQIRDLSEVEYAEPNYIVHTTAVDTSNDPLYSQQWGISAIKLDQLWQQTTISDKPIIAILDTGVDITHPDLKDNIWSNYSEVNGTDGRDDDGNGYTDDLHGWDFINQTGTIADYNGHGTHCAGIAAATGANGIGVIGANPDAWILPVTVMQSNGTGDIATIIKGIDYATSVGADVISMSFGTYSSSTALEQALGKAYSKSVLVAAAGNDNICIYPHLCSVNKKLGATMFPAGYTFVLGVQATDQSGSLASFSNFDEDGPIYSTFDEEKLYNYEIKAPGSSIISTYPNGQYKSLNGTSMACPLVAGAISRLMQCKSYSNKETLFADIINSANDGLFNVLATYNISDNDRTPSLDCVGYTIDDTESGDGDLRADAGETLAIYPTLRNEWGIANNIKIWMTMGELEDASRIEFLNTETVDFGSNLNSYAKAKAINPIRIKVADDTADGRIIKLQLHATCDNISEEMVQNIELTVESCVELGGFLDHDMTLTPDVHYKVTSNFVIPDSITLTILPGTEIELTGLNNMIAKGSGIIKAEGEPGNMIRFTSDGTLSANAYASQWGIYYMEATLSFNDLSTVRYCRFEDINQCDIWNDNCFDNCIFRNNYSCRFGGQAVRCTFDNTVGAEVGANLEPEYCNIANISYNDENGFVRWRVWDGWSTYLSSCFNNNLMCNTYVSWNRNTWPYIVEEHPNNFSAYSSDIEVIKNNGNYLGSSREDIVRDHVADINDSWSTSLAQFDISTIVKTPIAEAHGCVWKVVVNGYDAQDEFEALPPLGVGRHKFEVYFNRPMNTAVAPTITMGVRAPYTQTTIGEDGSWNEAGDIYTAYLTINGKSDIDGTNRIYVTGAEDDEYFECPYERDRFNVIVQAAGSLSAGFMAEAGLDKVTLSWDNSEENFDDMLGYNLYRYTLDENNVASDTIRVNTRVLDAQQYVDENVVAGTTYYYYYKVMTTDLSENSPSTVVAATPYTAPRGDANGSMSVDVADVVSEVAYMLCQDPQPFYFEAADVNSDNDIDILDVVGTVNIIKNPNGADVTSVESVATYTVRDGILYVDSPVDLGGVQVQLTANNNTTFEAMEALTGFEQVGSWQNDNTEYLFLAFSLTGKTIAAGENALLNLGDAEVKSLILSDATGKNIPSVDGSTSGVGTVLGMQMRLPYPNPFDSQLTVPYVINGNGAQKVRISMVDLSGRTVATYRTTNSFGEYSHTFATDALSRGVYLVTLYVNNNLMQTVKVIKK
jgi:subtilisin family serine protease